MAQAMGGTEASFDTAALRSAFEHLLNAIAHEEVRLQREREQVREDQRQASFLVEQLKASLDASAAARAQAAYESEAESNHLRAEPSATKPRACEAESSHPRVEPSAAKQRTCEAAFAGDVRSNGTVVGDEVVPPPPMREVPHQGPPPPPPGAAAPPGGVPAPPPRAGPMWEALPAVDVRTNGMVVGDEVIPPPPMRELPHQGPPPPPPGAAAPPCGVPAPPPAGPVRSNLPEEVGSRAPVKGPPPSFQAQPEAYSRNVPAIGPPPPPPPSADAPLGSGACASASAPYAAGDAPTESYGPCCPGHRGQSEDIGNTVPVKGSALAAAPPKAHKAPPVYLQEAAKPTPPQRPGTGLPPAPQPPVMQIKAAPAKWTSPQGGSLLGPAEVPPPQKAPPAGPAAAKPKAPVLPGPH